jgi:hypothetical protein
LVSAWSLEDVGSLPGPDVEGTTPKSRDPSREVVPVIPHDAEKVREALVHDIDNGWCFTCHEPEDQCDLPETRAALDSILTELAAEKKERDQFALQIQRDAARIQELEAALGEIAELEQQSHVGRQDFTYKDAGTIARRALKDEA